MPSGFSASASPMPDSIRICGELIAPPETITSRRARIRTSWPLCRYSTPTARVPSNRIRVTRHRGSTRRFRRAAGRPQIRHRGAPAAAPVRRHVHPAEAFLPVAVHVVGLRVPGLPSRVDERAIERILHRARRDVERAAAAAIVVGALEARFGALEIGQAVRVRPVREALRVGPAVVVERVAADVDHAVDRRRAAEHAPARARHAAPVHVRLGLGRVRPVVGVVGERVGERRRHVDEDAASGRPGLDQQDFDLRLPGQPVREHASGRPRADDDVVEFVPGGHRGAGPWLNNR